jgi:hypothetical protein
VWFWRPFDVTVRSEDGFRDGALGSTLETVDSTGGGYIDDIKVLVSYDFFIFIEKKI